MNNLKIFENQEFGQVRTLEEDGKPLFCGSDVAKALGYAKPHNAVNAHCKGATLKQGIIDSLGREQAVNFITEGDLYRLIVNSKLPTAEKFESWVFDEVLPSVRKQGSYKIPQTKREEVALFLGALEEQDEKIEAVNEDLQKFKTEMPIFGVECDRITNAVKTKGVACMGGKKSGAYNDKSLRGRVYSDIYHQLKREFDVTSYKAIKRNQADVAINIIRNYKMPLVLMQRVEQLNQQVAM
ncbi:ORF6C domain-containing protein [Anaerovorax sp. IOR16]|uniref:ORF6C domain-containing protein n=1 Tax=Anaerovorax sp. IOR16 TaxID=2773458 RepID=UPI0019D2A871|nr:ORF6C domain-containing protein [Anaerovorax sp. IOR16]